MSSPSDSRISPLEKIGYGFGDAASNIVFKSVLMFLAFFYTDIFGISAAAMGTMFLLVRILDAITDPVMGAVADRTNTRWGKFRPYLLWLAVPYALIAVIAFTTPDFGATGKLIYAYVTYALLMTIYTAINIPYCALGGVITPDSTERVSLNGYRFFLASAAGVLVASATLPLAEWLGKGNDQLGYQLTMAVFGGIAVLLFVGSFLLTKERVTQVSEKASSVKRDLKILFQNDQWVAVASMFFVLLIALVIRNAAALYYMKWYVGREDLSTAFLTVGMVSQMFGALVSHPLAKRVAINKSYMLIQGTVAVMSAAMFFLGAGNIALIFILFAIVSFFASMGNPILWTMLADTVEYGELKTERRVTGLAFSGGLFTLKLGMAVGGAILGWLLAFFGYQSGADVQATRTISGIVFLFTLVPAFWHLLLVGIVSRYKLTKEKCEEIRLELDARKATA